MDRALYGLWFVFGRDLGQNLSLGWLIGFGFPATPLEGADEAQAALVAAARETALDVWLYQYMIFCGAVFVALWGWLAPHRWFRWSVGASSVIIFITWFLTYLAGLPAPGKARSLGFALRVRASRSSNFPHCSV